ncbi:MAG: hypothetical protein ACRD1Z_11305, partial [Vicinamibacteria bacterium]
MIYKRRLRSKNLIKRVFLLTMLASSVFAAALLFAVPGCGGAKEKAAEGEAEAPKPESYEKWWGEFGAVLKEGLYEDSDNRPKLLELA